MASTSEVGHAKNVGNFQSLKAFAKGYGVQYNPSKAILTLVNLNASYDRAKDAMGAVTTANTANNTAVNNRADEFKDVPQLVTRLLNALDSSDASMRTVDDARGFVKKIRGTRAPKKAEEKAGEQQPVTISNSQKSFDNMIEHFNGIKTVLESEPSYAPNEADLQITAVEDKLTKLEKSNNAVATSEEGLSNSRLNRNKVLYSNPDSITELAAEVKKYVKSVFGATSPEFKQVSGLAFRVFKK